MRAVGPKRRTESGVRLRIGARESDVAVLIDAATAIPRREFIPHLNASQAAHPDDRTILGA